jgi:sulfatase maturation enzyme AslB (radical SAM superfamily)
MSYGSTACCRGVSRITAFHANVPARLEQQRVTDSLPDPQVDIPPTAVVPDAQLNVYNLAAMKAEPARIFQSLRVDPNNTCNVHCVYCHNHRSAAVIERQDLAAFLQHNVTRVSEFQMGCVMEPTLDSRLGDLLLDVAASPARPVDRFVLQTNGILLHQHDPGQLRESGLTHLALSIDAIDQALLKALRGGTSLRKVVTNLESMMVTLPRLRVQFVTTVTRLNVAAMADLVRFGLERGVTCFVAREVFYRADSDVVDHARMPRLLLAPGEFAAMATALAAEFSGRATFDFADRVALATSETRMLSAFKHSQPTGA